MNLFYSRPPAKIPKPAAQAADAEAAKTAINNQRRRGPGSYDNTIQGSRPPGLLFGGLQNQLKTALGQ